MRSAVRGRGTPDGRDGGDGFRLASTAHARAEQINFCPGEQWVCPGEWGEHVDRPRFDSERNGGGGFILNEPGEFESGATAAVVGPVGSVVMGGIGTLLVAAW